VFAETATFLLQKVVSTSELSRSQSLAMVGGDWISLET